MYARFEHTNSLYLFKVVVLRFQGAEEALNHCVVKAIVLPARTLLRPALLEHCWIERHLVVPALIKVLNKFWWSIQSGKVRSATYCKPAQRRGDSSPSAPHIGILDSQT